MMKAIARVREIVADKLIALALMVMPDCPRREAMAIWIAWYMRWPSVKPIDDREDAMSEHVGSIETDFIAEGYWATCTCDWIGPSRDTEWAAQQDLEQHYRPFVEEHSLPI